MPFGLTNAPESFQKLVNATLFGLKGLYLQVFIDDICAVRLRESTGRHVSVTSTLYMYIVILVLHGTFGVFHISEVFGNSVAGHAPFSSFEPGHAQAV